jgi:hypothetical protein
LPACASAAALANSRGLRAPGSDDAHYDQMALFPGPIEDAISATGVFDFDGAVFRDLWGNGTKAEASKFRSYVKYYLSDHRPLWAQLRL